MRLGKYLAHAGVASRRAAEAMIAQGRVTVDGEIVTRSRARRATSESAVSVDGRPLAGAEPRVVYAVHKPVGVVSTARDTHGRPTVVELVPSAGLRLYPVGRLDADSSGLILLSNDGELANRLTHPRFEVPKTYRARVAGAPVGREALARAARRRDARGRPHRARARAAPGAGHDRAEHPRGPQPPGAPDVRRGRPSGAASWCARASARSRSTASQPGAHRRLSEAEVERLRALSL